MSSLSALSRREEDNLLKAVKAKALKECDPLVKAFADCMSGRLVSAAWACKENLRAVEGCLIQYTGPEPMELARAEYLRLRNQQQEAKLQALDASK
ncbi:cox assembly mitochondrial protein-like protein [Moniliophthora roreri MCA 2997]|uniref:COX assembly mitochondrial protein n=2 Tax=Moniliophthora roreri TaxID=221103 RepID=V2XZN4_MONRO|nr:cox assembly mitochondrial protein-like protein [Moniliophthora roreri MCA 2997]KAI3622670.1 cox assembly mitochondrial protein-like protein [Moniliophthora roreri]